MKNYILILIAVIVFTLPMKNFSQTSNFYVTEKTSVPDEKIGLLFKKVLLETDSLESDENKILIKIHTIDLLWERDKETAIQVSQQTADLLRFVLNPNETEKNKSKFTPFDYRDLREKFITMLARHDFEFARRMKDFTRPVMLDMLPNTPSKKNQLRNWREKERQIEQRMAFHLSTKDLQKGFDYAVESLQKGFTNESINTLRRFHTRDEI